MPLLDTATETRYREQFEAIRQMPPPERFTHSIEDVGSGGYIRFEGKSYQVKGLNDYERQGYRWPELTIYCLNNGETSYLEWEKEDDVSVFVSREKLDFVRVGLESKEKLWKISDDEQGEARYGGKTFSYHEDSAVMFHRDQGDQATRFHQYLFAAPDRKAFIAIEEWGDDDEGYEHNVVLSEYIDPKAIDVLAVGGTG